MRSVSHVHPSQRHSMGSHPMRQPLPGDALAYLDPFLLLHHHGPHTFAPGNSGLPFGPHPHRGIETVTFILKGDVAHRDSTGSESVIGPGGVQWMTAGRGLIHAEQSSAAFKEKGGEMEILQLWINLPARLKMTEPFYQGWQQSEIPTVKLDEDRVTVHLVAGDWGQYQAAHDSATGVHLYTVDFAARGRLDLNIPEAYTVFFYTIRGSLVAGGTPVPAGSLAEFAADGDQVSIRATEESLLLVGYARPLNEPVVAQGPFVMNTQEEIAQAYDDYRRGTFGTWQHG